MMFAIARRKQNFRKFSQKSDVQTKITSIAHMIPIELPCEHF